MMTDWNNLLSDVQTFREWFVEAHSREPASLWELAKFLDDERGRGMFANARDVEAMYGLARYVEGPRAAIAP
jgi:hypothetical protein